MTTLSLEAIKAQTDLVALVGETVALRRAGPQFKGLCPFHKERSPSFFVHPAKNLYQCHGCKTGGSAIDWLVWRDGVSIGDAIRQLAARLGATVDAPKPGPRPAPLPPAVQALAGKMHPLLPLRAAAWDACQHARTGALERFAHDRRLPVDALRAHDVVDMPGGGAVGFGYRDPATCLPCRVKVRTVATKRFWIEPRPDEVQAALRSPPKALAPLYLAHDLEPPTGVLLRCVIVTEGEVDALTLRIAGFRNVVSLPDGVASAETVDLVPLYGRFTVWLAATDADEEGDKAFAALRDRGRRARIDVVRLKWQRTCGEEHVVYKDASDAWMHGVSPEELRRAVELATTDYFSFPVPA